VARAAIRGARLLAPPPGQVMVTALRIRGRLGHNSLINGVYEPAELKHNERGVWVSRAVRPLYLFHTGKSRWVVSKRVDDGARCYAFLTDTGSNPAKAQGGWTCCDEDGEWRVDPNIIMVATPSSNDKFVHLRMSLDQELEKHNLNDPKALRQLWKRLDCNGNGLASLAEVDKLVVDMVKGKAWPEWLNNKPALMRAFKAADLDEGDGDGWVEIGEFHGLLLDIFWFNKLWKIFDVIDAGHDHKISPGELAKGMGELGLKLTQAEAEAEFGHIDSNHDGSIRFVEFCAYARDRLMPDEDHSQDPDIISGQTGGVPAPRKKRKGKRAAGLLSPGKPPVPPGGPRSPSKLTKKCLQSFTDLEEKFKALIADQAKLKKMWSQLDVNGNGLASLAELDKLIVEAYPLLDHKPATMRAYKATCGASKEASEDYVRKKDFKCFLANILYFNKLFWLFDHVDADADRRLHYKEFTRLLSIVGEKMSEKEMQSAFSKVDRNGGGCILFDEFCRFVTEKHCPESLTALLD